MAHEHYTRDGHPISHSMAIKPKRNYKKENAWEDTPEQVKRREGRNKARAMMAKKGLVRKGDTKEVDHKNFNALNDSASNLHVISRHANRIKQPKHKGRK